ncbi:response regulator transcription factor [uncultured Paraglaciecola sp.]|uniref:response regulator transcription factor n=1 Tax=uncultured Paraglaciecola sp. TaxID=1765024 RepID=UPI00262B33C9|nr:response regulator transcription factor [uncultured Paraglaciecola sp.]
MKIIIADDHPIFRSGLQATISDVFGDVNIRQAGQMDGLRKHLKTDPADLLLLDIFFPGLEPEEMIKELRHAYPLMAILVVSMLIDTAAVERLLRAGANGFVSKTAPPKSLQNGLNEVMDGGRPVYLPQTGHAQAATSGDSVVKDLPKRQKEVLHLICLGLSNKEIARELHLSASTVRAHISALFRKLDVANRAAAASYGARYGVLGAVHKAEDR